MILGKAVLPPACTPRAVKRKLSLFREREGRLLARGLHCREREGAILCAEGVSEGEPLEGKLFCAGGERDVFAFSGGTLTCLGSGERYAVEELFGIVTYRAKDGIKTSFALCKDGVYALSGGEKTRLSEPADCAAIHRERLFLARGNTVCWSAPLSPSNFSEQDAGYADLPSGRGKIVSLVPFCGKLYLFRENGIDELAAPGEAIGFRLNRLPCACGELIRGTVRDCGGSILFLTKNGLYSFNGSVCTRLGGCGSGEIEPSEEYETAAAGGKYYAAVRVHGENCVWCVDPAQESGHFIRVQATSVAGGETLSLIADGKLCGLTPKGMPPAGRREWTLSTEPSLLGLSAGRKYLDAVAVEGEGDFRIEARAESGPARAASGRAGERLRFPLPVRGTSFSFRIRSISENARIERLVFMVREEKNVW